MTPERVKTIRHALRRSDGRKPTQRQVSKFLRMGEVSLPRYESGAQTPTDCHALLLEMLTDRRIVKRIARANERAQHCTICQPQGRFQPVLGIGAASSICRFRQVIWS